MRGSDFDHKLSALRQRVKTLQQHTIGAPAQTAGATLDAFEELQIALEELGVAEEELCKQNEELTATRQALQEEHQRYQELFDFAPDGYLVTDTAAIIREANRAAAALLAVRQDHLVGKPLAVFVSQEELKTFRTRLLRLPQLECVQEWEIRLQPRQGAPFHAAITVMVVRDFQGQPIGLRWLLRDISVRKALAESAERQRLQNLVQHLPEGVALLEMDRRLVLANPAACRYLAALTETAVGERVLALGEQPVEWFFTPRPEGLPHEVVLAGLPRRIFEIRTNSITTGPEGGGWVLLIEDVTAEREAQQQMEQQGRLAAIGQLAAGIAHDFNNLLTVMIGSANMLKVRADLPESVKGTLGTIADQGRQGAHLVRQILDFSRQSIGQFHSLELLPLLKETLKLLDYSLPESIRIVLESTPGDYRVNADMSQMQQLLTNLAVNARDAMSNGGELRFCLSSLTLCAGEPSPCADMPVGRWVVLTVSDTGTGISPEVLDHIFEPFFTTKQAGQGTGLGLAQVYGIVKQHNGYLTVRSQLGEGTTFTLYLPALEMLAEATGEAAPEEYPQGQGETVLLVEDDPSVLEALQLALDYLQYRVLTASNGQEALQIVEQHSDAIALILTDLVMPDIDGVALFHALRQQNPCAKVIILTGYPLGDGVNPLLRQGVIACLHKPPDLLLLAQTVRRALVEIE
jgi:PAS domain S-box-containing protein